MSVASLYVVRALPNIGLYTADALLEWRDVFFDSLEAYRSMVAGAMAASTTVDDGGALDFLTVVGADLDRADVDVEEQARAATMWQTTKSLWPSHAATAAGAFTGFSLTIGNDPIIALVTAFGSTIAQGLRTAATALHRVHNLQCHPMLWRYDLHEAEQWD